jgi:hypothetical protein
MAPARLRALVMLALAMTCVACRRIDPPRAGLNADDDLELSTVVIRADFSDDAAWQNVWESITAPVGTYKANLIPVENREYDGLTPERLLTIMPKDSRHTFMFIVDRTTLVGPEHPVLVVDVAEQPGRTFKVIPREMWSVQNNLKLANMDWEDFSESADPDGVFRGFRR